MDYNYVRMRKSIYDGDSSRAAYYKNLCNKGMDSRKNTSLLCRVLICLIIISVVLGGYIAYAELTRTADITYNSAQEVMK